MYLYKLTWSIFAVRLVPFPHLSNLLDCCIGRTSLQTRGQKLVSSQRFTSNLSPIQWRRISVFLDDDLCYRLPVWYPTYHASQSKTFGGAQDGQVSSCLLCHSLSHSAASWHKQDFHWPHKYTMSLSRREKTERKALNAMLLKFQVKFGNSIWN